MYYRAIALAFVTTCLSPHPSGALAEPDASLAIWQNLVSGVDISLRGLSAIDGTTAWASGQRGTVLRTVDSGQTWENVSVPDADDLDFRDVQAFSAQRAIVLSAGEPARMFKTIDAGETWREVYSNDTPGVFFDGMDFWDDQRGLAFSDPIDGRFLIVKTENGGETWRPIDASRTPPALDGEAGFAASGTCLRVGGEDLAWIGLGGAGARVLVSTDGGEHWTAVPTPMAHSPSAGIFSLAVSENGAIVAVGGNYESPDVATRNAAFSTDNGQTWQLARQSPQGYRSAVDVSNGAFIATGPNGTDVSYDGGRIWNPLFDGQGFHALDITPDGTVWAVGTAGRIGRAMTRPQ